MTGKYFLDTNFLVYCYSEDEPAKRKRCLEYLREMQAEGIGVSLSSQVLQEFANVLLKKFEVEAIQVKSVLKSYEQFEVLLITPEIIQQALDLVILHNFNFWDALIVSTALSGNCSKLITDDLQDGQEIRGLTFTNPF